MKIFVGRFGHECNTMSPLVMEFEDVLRTGDFCRGEESLRLFEGTPEYLGGMIACAREKGTELVATISTEVAMPRLSRACVDRCMELILEDLRACRDSIDGICLVLHGAGCAVGIDDLETWVLREIRKEVGPDMPITVPLDLHGVLTEEMLPLADAFFSIKEYPHTDYAECGYLAMKTLIEMIESGRRPRQALVRIPILPPEAPDACTLDEPMLSINAHFAALTRQRGLLDAALMHGFDSVNLPFASMSVLAVGWDDPTETARELADYVWQRRRELFKKKLGPAEAFDMAEAFGGEGYILMNEPSDNPGGGAPGDGTFLLREMLRRDLPGSIFCHMHDREVAAQAIEAGVGAHISCLLGGKVDSVHGESIFIEDAEVLAVSDGAMISNSPMMLGVPRNVGPTARLRLGNVEIIVVSGLIQTLDDRPFAICGTAAENYRYVAIKSAAHFKAFYKDHAALILAVDTPGHRSGRLCDIYNEVRRPIYPLDEM